MVQEILSHNGDVLKFSGDAFIVMWKLHEGMMMRDLAIAAMQTACIIQKHFGSYDTEVGVTLKGLFNEKKISLIIIIIKHLSIRNLQQVSNIFYSKISYCFWKDILHIYRRSRIHVTLYYHRYTSVGCEIRRRPLPVIRENLR